jgi:hypothetical protein
VGVTHPPTELLGIAKDLRAWQHVERTVSELASDEFARRELRAQIRYAKEKLNEQSDLLMGWNQSGGRVIWFNKGQEQKIEQDGLSSLLSKIAEDFYKDGPIITNEMINRRVTSSAASRARTVLIDAIAKNPEMEVLGMDAFCLLTSYFLLSIGDLEDRFNLNRDVLWQATNANGRPGVLSGISEDFNH